MYMKQITPFVPCTSLNDQICFYQNILGFSVGFQADNYAFLHRDGVALRLVEVDPKVDLSNAERQGSFYIDVEGIDDLYAAMESSFKTLPAQRVRGPFNQSYGQREFHVADEDCTLVFFGEAV